MNITVPTPPVVGSTGVELFLREASRRFCSVPFRPELLIRTPSVALLVAVKLLAAASLPFRVSLTASRSPVS